MSRRSSAVRSQLLMDVSETDLDKLQLQYRRAEGAMRTCSEKTQGLLYRDKRLIQRLQDEHEWLLQRVSQSCFDHWADTSVVQDLTTMLTSRERIDEELEAEKSKVASLKDQILKWERKLVGQRTGGGTTHCSSQSDKSNFLKRTCIIENKLCRARQYNSKVMTRNGELREELKILQVEKKQFLHVHSQKKKELHAIRKDIFTVMTKCTEAFNASAKIKEKLRMLREQDAKDMVQYIKERSNLEQEISHYCYFETFLGIKGIARNNQGSNHRQVEKCKQLESKELRLEDFEDAFKQILKETEESDLDKLIRNFIQMEKQNCTLLNFVNYQRDEAETIRRKISQLCSEIEVCVAVKQQQQEQHQALRMRVSNDQETAEQHLAVSQQHVQFMERLLDRFKEGLESLLQISYDKSVVCHQLDSSDRFLDENIKEYLTKVEDRVNELLTLQSCLHFKEKLSQWDIDCLSTIAGQILGITAPAVSLIPAAATPAPECLSDDPDLVASVLLKAEEPVSREDLLTLVSKRIQRQKTD